MYRLKPTRPDPRPGEKATARIEMAGVTRDVCERHLRLFEKFMKGRGEKFSWSVIEREEGDCEDRHNEEVRGLRPGVAQE